MEQDVKGSFRPTKAGKIEYRFPYYDEYGKRRVKSVTAATEDDCLDKADAFIDDLKNIRKGVDYNATIADIMRHKVERDYKKNYTGIQGYDRNLATIKIIERSIIGHVPIAKIDEKLMDQFLESITTYSNTMIRKIYTMVSVAYRLAYSKGIIQDNFMLSKDLRCPRSQKKDKKVRGLTEDEQQCFIRALRDYRVPYGRNNYKSQLLIELYSGLRMGEINALTPGDVDFKKGIIHVHRTISRGIGGKEFLKDTPKTEAGIRDVPIGKVLRPILERAIKEMKENPDNLIFYDHVKNDVISTLQVNSFYTRLCEKAKIECNGQHALRHTFATRCIEAGVPAIVLKNWLGHTDIHITLDTYSDVFSRLNLGAIDKFDNFIDDAIPEPDIVSQNKESSNVVYLHAGRSSIMNTNTM